MPFIKEHEATIKNTKKFRKRNKAIHKEWAKHDEQTRKEKDAKIAENEKYPWHNANADEDIWKVNEEATLATKQKKAKKPAVKKVAEEAKPEPKKAEANGDQADDKID